jgi:hypothetical protein
MNRQAANSEVLNPQVTPVQVQKSKAIPPLWDQLSLQYRKQLAQQLAKMIQQYRQAPNREKSSDERI